MPRLRASIAVAGLMLAAAACSADSGESAPKTPATYHPPPPPGQSIHSSMCTCRACSKADCCGGSEEPGAGEGKHCEGNDFGAEGCALSVGSCTTRCYEEIWRVQRGHSCAEKRPAVCCESRAAAD